MIVVSAMVQELLKINVAQGLQDTVNSQTFMGRCVIDIGKFSKTPNESVDDWVCRRCLCRIQGPFLLSPGMSAERTDGRGTKPPPCKPCRVDVLAADDAI